jgi:hypothetical protein
MSYFAKQRLFYYKNFKLDLWGIVRNTLQYKIDKTNYNVKDVFKNAKYNSRIGSIPLYNYKWNKYRYYKNRNEAQKAKLSSYKNFVFKYRIRSVLYFYLLFYFFKTKIKNRLYKAFKFIFIDDRYFKKNRYYPTPFIYEPRIYNIFFKKIKKDMRSVSLQLVRLFYIIYSYKQLRKLVKRAKRSIDLFEAKFLALMECKLPSFLYRTSLIANMFESLIFIKNHGIIINKQQVNNIYYVVKVMDFVELNIYSKGYIYWAFYKRVRRKAFLFLLPKYMFISLIFLLIILIRFPLSNEIINPIKIDMYRVANYLS